MDPKIRQKTLRMLSNGVYVLTSRNDDRIARRFFFPTRTKGATINGQPFADGRTVAPILTGLPAHVECHVERIVDTDGDHAVVILRVVEAECREPVRPLTVAQTAWEYGG